MKRCTRCGQEKLESKFHRDKSRPDGLRSECKVCKSQRAKDYRAKHPEETAAWQRTWSQTKRGKECIRVNNQKARANGRIPHQRKAHSAVQHELKMGKMTRLPCKVCGDPKSQGHHEDYDKPLEVVWLCQKHHKARHREIDARKKTAP